LAPGGVLLIRVPNKLALIRFCQGLKLAGRAVGVHVGNGNPQVLDLVSQYNGGGSFWKFRIPVIGACHSVMMSEVPHLFPKLRFHWAEAAAQWIPYVVKDLRRRWGRVISISSVVGLVGNPGQANYAASKAGLVGLTMSVAREVAGRGITVNAVAPGYIPSKLTDAMSEEAKQATLGQIPAGRLGTPEEVAAAVRFLASEEAGYITGQVLAVDGGMSMGT
jgi:NAD(P)-dependent dehydrogenase (short-subunit alcohol dehydrogenase family)